MKKISYLILLISLFMITIKVNALTYNLEDDGVVFTFSTSYSTSNSANKLNYIGDSGIKLTKFKAQVESVNSDSPDYNPGLFPGQYLIEFYLYGVGDFTTLTCSNLTSNFGNVNTTSGNWVTNEIQSQCVDVYKTTYNNRNAYRMLYKFTFTGEYATELSFQISADNFITAYTSGMNYGLSYSNIYTYDSAIVDNFNSDKLQQKEINQNEEIINKQEWTNSKLDENNSKLDTQIQQNNQAEETRKGMWETLKSMLNYINPLSEDFFAYKLVELMLNMLKSLFIPEDMDFVTNFVDALESKLGFIAAIPVKIIEFTMGLASATWSEFNSISLPSISIFGYNFWNAQEIDLTEAINIFKPFKYVTDVICVVLCARTLNKWREQFTGGSGK